MTMTMMLLSNKSMKKTKKMLKKVPRSEEVPSLKWQVLKVIATSTHTTTPTTADCSRLLSKLRK